jgi:hypothetical protein
LTSSQLALVHWNYESDPAPPNSGPAGDLVLGELPDLEPGPGQVRIAVAAAGVHLLDTTPRRGEPGPIPAPPLPTIPGREAAGVVAHLGPVPGGHAEHAVCDVHLVFELVRPASPVVEEHARNERASRNPMADVGPHRQTDREETP